MADEAGPTGADPRPIIVFGAPRSGTTYLQRCLNAHPRVFVSHETRIFAWLHRAAVFLPTQDQFVVTERERFSAHLRRELPGTIRRFYADIAPHALHWGDKNPHYADPANEGVLDTVASLFPGTRFVHIIRFGPDVVASLMRRRHADGTPWADFEAAHHTWVRHVTIGRDFGARVAPHQYHELRYEDLVTDDEATVRALFGFLGIGVPPSVTDFCRAQREKRTPFSTPMSDLSGPLSGISGRDRADLLTRDERRASVALLAPTLEALGYPVPDPEADSGSMVAGS